MDQDRIKHLEMIQDVIARLAGHSFALRGWSVVIVSAIFALSAKEATAAYLAVALVPSLAFCLLDAYYLWQERLFRALYNAVCADPASVPLFSMDVSTGKGQETYRGALWCSTVLGFHVPIVITVVGVIICTWLAH